MSARWEEFSTIQELEEALLRSSYLPDRGLATALFLALKVRKPLLLEGEAGVGKTEAAKAIASSPGEDRFDRPALTAALATEACYIGALGSRRNQQRRRERMLEAGIDEVALERISGPCGLDIGAESQDETAISIIAEMLGVRAGRAGGRLRDAGQRIHAQAE